MDITVCGNVVITDHALIVISPNPATQARRQAAGSFAAHAVGGALGGAIAAATRPGSIGSGGLLNLGDGKEVPPLLHIDRILTCWPSEVPMELRDLSNWPRISEDRAVTFYPRALMGAIAVSWTGTLRVTFPGVAAGPQHELQFLAGRQGEGSLRQGRLSSAVVGLAVHLPNQPLVPALLALPLQHQAQPSLAPAGDPSR